MNWHSFWKKPSWFGPPRHKQNQMLGFLDLVLSRSIWISDPVSLKWWKIWDGFPLQTDQIITKGSTYLPIYKRALEFCWGVFHDLKFPLFLVKFCYDTQNWKHTVQSVSQSGVSCMQKTIIYSLCIVLCWPFHINGILHSATAVECKGLNSCTGQLIQ